MIRRADFREVTPTQAEIEAFRKAQPRRPSPPVRAEHLPCHRRIWYSGLAIGAHMRACPAHKTQT